MHQLILKSGRERSLINRHPWVYSGAVKKMPAAQNGEIVEIVSSNFELLGYGFFSPNSQITCRVFEFCNTPKNIDANYWDNKIIQAASLRKQLIDTSHTTMYRLIHAEGDFFPGLIVDIYNNVAVLQVLVKGVEYISEFVFKSLQNLGFQYIYLKTKQNTQILEDIKQGSRWVGAEPKMPIVALENGIKFNVNVETGQKTGFFIDQRENRSAVGSFSKGYNVLNTFCYSGGFSIYALHNNANLVHSVDSSKDAIELCNQNVLLNGFTERHTSYVADCFDFLKDAHENFYDLIVLDPPAFAKNARNIDNASRGYKNLNLLGIKKIKPGGLIFTFSCSQHIDKDLFRKIVFGAAADAQRNVQVIQQLHQPKDHPINIFHPEGEYLKGLLLKVY
ncbi:MAG: class I SAM-dependent rRNA methyltransferase [Bacteroidia bacterium]